MGIDLTSFVLEIANFLVLLWLLKRFLYGPVQAAIGRRQQAQSQAQAALEEAQRALAAERAGVSAERAQAAAQRDQALGAVAAEVEAERARRLQALDADMAAERLKLQARMTAQEAQRREALERDAGARAEAFVRQYVQRLAGPALEGAVIGLFLADLEQVPEARRRQLADLPAGGEVEVATAFEPDGPTRGRVEQALGALLGHGAQTRWSIDPDVVAGIRVRLDGHLLEASLARSLDALRAAPGAAA